MSEAFTVRLRTSGGRHFLWTAPAGGMGLSSPCCDGGHSSPEEATDCGITSLKDGLLGLRLRPAS